MSQPDRMPQVEVAVGGSRTVLLLRHLQALTVDDLDDLRRFADAHGIVWYLQAGGLDSATLFHPADAPMLSYGLPDFGLDLLFHPTEFTQVNDGVNRMLVRRAMALLKPQAGERIADLFCGLGNFTLPIARLGARVSRCVTWRARAAHWSAFAKNTAATWRGWIPAPCCRPRFRL